MRTTPNSLALPRETTTREQLEAWAAKGHLYALVDTFFDIPVPIERVKLETKDTDPVFYEVIAWDQVTYEPPYLAKLSPEALDWINNALSTERWGIFVAAETNDLAKLARHFQKFVIARGPDQNPYFLRFHDAAVLDVLLRTWDPKERAIFYGPVAAFGLPDLDTVDTKLEENSLGRQAAWPSPEDCLIQLRDSQLKLCSEAIDRDLVKVIYWHLRNHHAKSVQFVDKVTLEIRVGYSIEKARRYGLGTISDLAGFAALMFELAPNFDEHPSFKRVLEDPSLPPDAKMRKLSHTISDREWSEATRLYDRTFWTNRVPKRPGRR
ncbi:MAG: DUF4123 domain-containing protein [Bdellovibrionota bacterium]